MIKQFRTRTGAIFCDTEKKMEYLYVGDYGKENNIKADFLGFKKEINQVLHHEVDLSEKMVVTISTQKGCPMNCMFCDCPKVKFGGNISLPSLTTLIKNSNQQDQSEMEYKFKAKDLKTGEWVEGDLVYARVANFKTGVSTKKKPMIVTMHIHGGILWAGSRHFVDESTVELIQTKHGNN